MSRLASLLLRPPEARQTELLWEGSLGSLAGGEVSAEDNAKWWGQGDQTHGSTSYIVRRCVGAIAPQLASLDLVVLNPDGEEVEHPFAGIFNKGGFNQPMSARIVKETAFARLEFRGQAFLWLDRGPSGAGPYAGVTPLYGQTKPVLERKDGVERLIGYKTRVRDGSWRPLLPSEVLWLRYPDPDDPWGCVAPWTAAARATKLDALAQGWQEQELLNGNRAAALVHLGDMTPEGFAEARADWNRTMVGPASSARAFLTAGPVEPKIARLGLTAKEAAYLDTRRVNAEEVCIAFGLDVDYVFGNSTFENKGAAKRQLWSDGLVPKLEVISSEVDRQVLPEPNLEAGWDLSDVEALAENEDAQLDRVMSMLDHDAITIDEARAERGLDPLPNGLGDLTLTQYREQAPSAGLPESPSSSPADTPARALLSAPVRRYVTRRGLRVRRPEIVAQRARHALDSRASRAQRDERTVQRVYDRLTTRGEKVIRRYAERQAKVVARNFSKATRSGQLAAEQRVQSTDFYDAHYWKAQAKDALDTWLSDVFDEGGTRTASYLAVDWSLYDRRVTAAMEARLDLLAEQITGTTQAAIESGVIARGAEQGWDIPTMAAALQDVFEDLTTWRATAIARTETVGGFNASSRTVAASSGVVEARQWLAAHDDRVRDSHRSLDGYRTTAMDDPYPNGCMYPGDPSAPPRETVQCRCVEIYVMKE